MRLKIIAVFLSLFVFSAPAYPWMIQAGLALAGAVQGFTAASPMTFDPDGNPKMQNGSKSMKVSLKGSLAAHAAAGALFAAGAALTSGASGFTGGTTTVGTCAVGSQPSGVSLQECVDYANTVASYPFAAPCAQGNSSGGGGSYVTCGHAFYSSGDIGSWTPTGTETVTPLDQLNGALAADPSQTMTDNFLGDVKAFAGSNPSAFADLVTMDEGTMGVVDGVFYDNTGASNTITSDGAGNVSVNGSPVTTSPVNNAGGTLSTIESGSDSKPIVDGNPVQENNPTGDPTPPSGSAGSTGDDMGAVVESINNLKNKNAQGSADVVSALNAVKGSVDSIQGYTDPCVDNPDRAGCQTLGTGSGAPSLSTETIDLGSALTPVDVGQGVGVCPDSMSSTYQGQALGFDFTKACSFLIDIRPVVLGMAWFTAALIFVGGVKTE